MGWVALAIYLTVGGIVAWRVMRPFYPAARTPVRDVVGFVLVMVFYAPVFVLSWGFVLLWKLSVPKQYRYRR